MKTKNKKLKTTLNAIGAGARLVYLEQHPHGFSAVNKIHKSKKSYNRKEKPNNF
jgi:hypothetical protein